MKLEFNVSRSEMSAPLLLFLWAIWFVLFDPIGSSPSYAGAKFLGNTAWAIIFGIVGVVRAAGILSGNLNLRRAGVGAALALWIIMFLIFAVSNIASHAVPTCLFLAFFNLLSLDGLYGNSNGK